MEAIRVYDEHDDSGDCIFEQNECLVTDGQQNHRSLPVAFHVTDHGICVTTRWKPTERDLAYLATGGHLLVMSIMKDIVIYPMRVQVSNPVESLNSDRLAFIIGEPE